MLTARGRKFRVVNKNRRVTDPVKDGKLVAIDGEVMSFREYAIFEVQQEGLEVLVDFDLMMKS